MKAIVIGGTTGIGAATVERLKMDGLDAYGVGRDECDVRSTMQVVKLVAQNHDVSIWVYCAGVNRLEWVDNVTDEMMFDLYDVNVFGFLRFVKALRWHRQGNLATDIVAVGSEAADVAMRTSSVYCGSKAALHQTARCLARECGLPWRINVVAPGMTEETEMQKYVDERVPEIRGWTKKEARSYELAGSPIGRRGTVEEVADVIVSTLNGPELLTGSIIKVNGGR